jgi:hypothetical protein
MQKTINLTLNLKNVHALKLGEMRMKYCIICRTFNICGKERQLCFGSTSLSLSNLIELLIEEATEYPE